tara:strand:+ start:57 stop:278 length:222 start_codon:yes stop_codon:yes gene_type:complete
MYSFVFHVKKGNKVIGYDFSSHIKNIINYNIKPGIYLAFSIEDSEEIDDYLLYFLYNNKVLLIKKKIALELKI